MTAPVALPPRIPSALVQALADIEAWLELADRLEGDARAYCVAEAERLHASLRGAP